MEFPAEFSTSFEDGAVPVQPTPTLLLLNTLICPFTLGETAKRITKNKEIVTNGFITINILN